MKILTHQKWLKTVFLDKKTGQTGRWQIYSTTYSGTTTSIQTSKLTPTSTSAFCGSIKLYWILITNSHSLLSKISSTSVIEWNIRQGIKGPQYPIIKTKRQIDTCLDFYSRKRRREVARDQLIGRPPLFQRFHPDPRLKAENSSSAMLPLPEKGTRNKNIAISI